MRRTQLSVSIGAVLVNAGMSVAILVALALSAVRGTATLWASAIAILGIVAFAFTAAHCALRRSRFDYTVAITTNIALLVVAAVGFFLPPTGGTSAFPGVLCALNLWVLLYAPVLQAASSSNPPAAR